MPTEQEHQEDDNLTTERQAELASTLEAMPGSERKILFNSLAKQIFDQGYDAPVIVGNPEEPGDIIGYFHSYAVHHNLSDLGATSKSTREKMNSDGLAKKLMTSILADEGNEGPVLS